MDLESMPHKEAEPVQDETVTAVTSSTADFEKDENLLTGRRFWCTMIGLYTGLFLVTLEMTIVSTAMVSITNDLQAFGQATWIINAYFLTWSGFLLLWSQFSYTLGRKNSYLIAFFMFVVFSIACGSSQTSIQLNVFRAFQGISGAGLFTMPIMIVSEAAPPASLPKYTATMSLCTVVSFVIGPLMGGAIVRYTTWRWVFLLNIPPGVIAFLLILIGLPANFPHHLKTQTTESTGFKLKQVRELDAVGGLLWLTFTILIVTVFQEAGNAFSWNSAFVVSCLVISISSLLGFSVWERFISLHKIGVKPLIDWVYFERRVIAMFVSSALIGVPFTTALLQIPQRLQVVTEYSSLQAGISLLPYIVFLPVGTMAASILSGPWKVKPLYGTLIGTAFQFVGIVCFAALPVDGSPQAPLSADQYVLQAILGFGNGLAYTMNFNGTPYVLKGRRELVPAAMGAITQFRYVGAAIGVAVMTAALNTYVKENLSLIISSADITAIFQSSEVIGRLALDQQIIVRETFANGFRLQWRILCGFIGVQVIAVLLTF